MSTISVRVIGWMSCAFAGLAIGIQEWPGAVAAALVAAVLLYAASLA